MKHFEIATLFFVSALIFNAGCAKNDDPQPKEYDNLIVYGNTSIPQESMITAE